MTASANPVARSRRRRLVVHAGTAKTGSTTIQRVLAALDPALRERGLHIGVAARGDTGLARHANLLRGFPRRCGNRVEGRSREAGAPREGAAA